jgi:hypothetical protein
MVKSLSPGGVAERPMAHVLKTCLGHTNVGSNPTPSARRIIRSDSFSNCPCATRRRRKVATTKKWGGARVAEWARLLSECWVKPVAGSNPALPAIKNALPGARFLFSIGSRGGFFLEIYVLPIPFNIKGGCFQRAYLLLTRDL